MEKRVTKRDLSKAATREKAISAARSAFQSTDYNSATIRSLAKEMGMSTGAIFANFTGKADLWRAAMSCEPPVDDPLTRARFAMRDALDACWKENALGEHSAKLTYRALRLAGVLTE